MLLPAVCLPWEAFLALCPSHVCFMSLLCASRIPSQSAQGHRGMGWGWGWGGGAAKDTGSALWGPVGQAGVGSHPRRKGHSEVG